MLRICLGVTVSMVSLGAPSQAADFHISRLSLAPGQHLVVTLRNKCNGLAILSAFFWDKARTVEAALSIPLGLHESAFTLRRRGLIEAESYSSFETLTRRYMRSPVVQEWWARNRRGKDAAFVALMDGMIAKIQSQQVAAVKPEDTAA